MSALVYRPTENAALDAASHCAQQVPSVERVADLLIVARATDDRFGARHFSRLLDRILEGSLS